jgi:hypothetical protein
MSRPIAGPRAFNRISAPDANSCGGCHNLPHGIVGGGGDFVTNVFLLGQRFDFMTFDRLDSLPTRGTVDETGEPASLQDAADLRSSTGMFGSGYLEMLARQMTEELQRTRDAIRLGETKDLVAKGVSFSKLSLTNAVLYDTTKVEGLGRLSLVSPGSNSPPSLVIRPWHQASNVVSLREFANTAFNQHHGIQSTERFGLDTDPDGDGFKNELTRADVTAVAMWQATLQVPGRVIPRHPDIERAVLIGERAFERVGCATCHVPRMALDKQGWIFSEPNPFNPPGNLRMGETRELRVDLSGDALPAPRLRPDVSGTVWVEAYTDFKLHDICGPGEAERIDQNAAQWSPRLFAGNCRFLTKRLWGAANEPPFFHHGLFTTLRKSVLAHSGEALAPGVRSLGVAFRRRACPTRTAARGVRSLVVATWFPSSGDPEVKGRSTRTATVCSCKAGERGAVPSSSRARHQLLLVDSCLPGAVIPAVGVEAEAVAPFGWSRPLSAVEAVSTYLAAPALLSQRETADRVWCGWKGIRSRHCQ